MATFRFERDALRAKSSSAISTEQRIRFQDVDAAGIIFYPRLFEYCNDLLIEVLEQCGAPLPEALKTGAWVSPIRHAEADYFRPLRFGDRIEVALVRVHLEPTQATLGFRVARLNPEGGEAELAAVAQSQHAFLNPQTFERIPIPEAIQAAFAAVGE